MPQYSIPTRYRSGFKVLLELDRESLSLLTSKLRSFPIGGGPKQLIEFLHDLPIPNTDEVARTIYSFGNILLDKNRDISKISTELVEYLLQVDPEGLNTEKSEYYFENLVIILESAGTIKTSYKALALSSDVPNVFRQSTILSDLRLVFPDDLEDMDRHSVMIHQLRFIYTSSDEDKSFYISLDRKDLEILKGQIDRALSKEGIVNNDYGKFLNIIKLGE